MTLYRCDSCNRLFYEPIEERMPYSSYVGVDAMPGRDTYITVTKCPFCEEEIDLDECELTTDETKWLEDRGCDEGDQYPESDYDDERKNRCVPF